MEQGQRWAYRSGRQVVSFTEVEVRVVALKERRVKVEWVEDQFAGKTKWIPMSRLEVLWKDLAPYADSDRKSRDLYRASVIPRETDHAAEHAFNLVLPEAVGTYLTRGVLEVHEQATLTTLSGLEAPDLLSHPATLLEDDSVFLPWPTALRVLRGIASRHPEALIEDIQSERQRMLRESVLGQDTPDWLQRAGYPAHRDGDAVIASFKEHVAPRLALFEEWMGVEVASDGASLADAQRELSRVGDIAQRAIAMVSSPKRRAALLEELQDIYSPLRQHGMLETETERVSAFATPYRWVVNDAAPSGARAEL
jgi:hypothetical protein